MLRRLNRKKPAALSLKSTHPQPQHDTTTTKTHQLETPPAKKKHSATLFFAGGGSRAPRDFRSLARIKKRAGVWHGGSPGGQRVAGSCKWGGRRRHSTPYPAGLGPLTPKRKAGAPPGPSPETPISRLGVRGSGLDGSKVGPSPRSTATPLPAQVSLHGKRVLGC